MEREPSMYVVYSEQENMLLYDLEIHKIKHTIVQKGKSAELRQKV